MRAVDGPDLAEAERPAGRRRRAVGLVEEPVVGPERPVEPDGVVAGSPRRSRCQPPPRRASPAPSSVRSLTKVSAAACTAGRRPAAPATRNQVHAGCPAGSSAERRTGRRGSAAPRLAHRVIQAARPPCRAGDLGRPRAGSPGAGTSGIGSGCSAPAPPPAGSRRSARRSRRPRPCGPARRPPGGCVNDRPSRIRSTA